jgi:hypothetical protein
MEQSKEVQLAYEIARALNDMKSIDWHIRKAKEHQESFLREKLAYVLSKPHINNPAGYYNTLIERHGKHPRS